MSALARELEVRHARFDALQVVMTEYQRKVHDRYGGDGYAYMAGFFQSQLMSLATESADTTDDLIKSLSANIN